MFVKNFLSKLRRLAVDTGERYYPVGSFEELDATHTTDYIFAQRFIESSVVLDAGCGCGFGCEYLATKGAKYVVGIDISSKAVKFARTYYNAANLDFMIMDVRHLGFRDGSFDVIVSFEVIEHLYDTKNYLFEISRVSRTDGVCIISTPNKRISSPRLKKPILPFHVQEFYPEDLYALHRQYFKEASILGKCISNEKIRRKEQNFRKGLRFNVIARLSQHESIRSLARVLPIRVKRIFTGSKEAGLKSRDFQISAEGVESAPYLLVICKKNKMMK